MASELVLHCLHNYNKRDTRLMGGRTLKKNHKMRRCARTPKSDCLTMGFKTRHAYLKVHTKALSNTKAKHINSDGQLNADSEVVVLE